MQSGKVSYNVLKRSVIRPTAGSAHALSAVGVGEDGSVFSMEKDGVFVMSTNPVMISGEDDCYWGVWRCLADIYSCGGTPAGIQDTIILPPDMEEEKLQSFMKQLAQVCQKAGVPLLGGHTTVSEAVSKMVVTLTAIGSAKEPPVRPDAGWDLVVTRWIGLGGTVLLAKEKEQELAKHYTLDFISGAKNLMPDGQWGVEARIGARLGAAMHNLSEGGVLGGLWELMERGSLGMEVQLKHIPIRQETVELSEYFGLNPYQMFSPGSYLMAVPNGEKLAEELERAGIPAAIIGRTTAEKARILYRDEEVRYLDRPAQDELYRMGILY